MRFAVCLNALTAFCLSFTLSACGKSLPSATSQPSGNPREALIKALRARLEAKSYRLNVIQTGTGGMHSTQGGEYIAPDKYHITARMSLGGRDSGPQEMIVIGTDAYMRPAGGEWRRTQIDPKQLELTRTRDQALIENLSKTKDEEVKFLGQENLNGSQTFVYQYSFAGLPEVPGRSQTKTWVGVSDGLPHKVEMDAETAYQGKTVGRTHLKY